MSSPYLHLVQNDYQNIPFGDFSNIADLTGAIVAFAGYEYNWSPGEIGDQLFETSSNGGLCTISGNNVYANLPSAYTNNINTTAYGRWFLRAQLQTGELKILDRGDFCVVEGLPTDMNALPYVPGQGSIQITPRPDITALIGGGATDLDGVDDTTLPIGTTFLLSYGRLPQFFQIFAGSDTTNVDATPAVVRVKTFSNTNQRIWLQLT